MADKERERAILRSVYRADEFPEVLTSARERPDFVLRRNDLREPFGVEVTELYQSDSLARFTRHPTYGKDLLDGGRHIHKDDVTALKVVTAQHRRGETDLGPIEAIIVPKLATQEYGDLLRSRIVEKSRRAAGYDSSLRHINLLVYDLTGTFRGWSRSDASTVIAKTTSYDAIAASPFRELFVVTSVEGGEWVVVPLKQHLLLAYAYAFDAAYSPGAPDDTSATEWFDAFATFMSERLIHVFRHLGGTGEPAVAYGNTSIGIRPGEDVSVYDHAELPLPEDAHEVPNSGRFSEEVHETFRRHLEEHDLIFGYVANVVGPPPI